ncbi:hypothetical protein [Herbidospora daliensis]|nr:hypothetical protein [Herbidospora daliensis]
MLGALAQIIGSSDDPMWELDAPTDKDEEATISSLEIVARPT